MADQYAQVQRSSLKIKGLADGGIKKKKKKRKKDKEKEKVLAEAVKSEVDVEPTTSRVDERTPAEIAFQKAREKRDAQTILERASKTHKDRIMDFNERLDQLTEHFDIPKVSWTK